MKPKKKIVSADVILIEPNTAEDLQKKYLKGQKVQFKCEKCQKVVITSLGRSIYNHFLCRTCKTKQTNLERYGTENINALQSKKDKTKQTNLERYGVENPFQTTEAKQRSKEWVSSKTFSEKLKESWKEKTEKDVQARYEKSKQTNLKKYGLENPFQDVNNIKNAVKEKYGVENVSQLDFVKQKKAETKQLHFGDPKFNNIQKAKETCLQKYGIQHGLNQRYNYRGIHMDSSWELALWIYAEDHNETIEREPCYFEYEFEGKKYKYYPDFRYKGDLIEIKGSQFLKADGSWQNPFDHSQDTFFKAKGMCAEKNSVKTWKEEDVTFALDYVKSTYSNDYLKLFLKSLPFPFPTKCCTDEDVIRFFHKSIYEASKKGKLSPLEAWQDKELIRKSALNRLRYVKKCTPESVLQGFSVAQIAPKVSVFKPKLAERLIKKYLNDFSEIFDPFSGFSGRLIGAFRAGKAYLGQDIHPKHVAESNEIIQHLNIEKAKIIQQNILTDTQKSFECLFTCPPYGGKEHWNERNDEVEKSCDEWIDLCLEKYKCKRYLFVVDQTEKYKDQIIEIIENKSHFGKNYEYVILLD